MNCARVLRKRIVWISKKLRCMIAKKPNKSIIFREKPNFSSPQHQTPITPMNPMKMAREIERLVTEERKSTEDIAVSFGRTKEWVRMHQKFLNHLDPNVQKMVAGVKRGRRKKENFGEPRKYLPFAFSVIVSELQLGRQVTVALEALDKHRFPKAQDFKAYVDGLKNGKHDGLNGHKVELNVSHDSVAETEPKDEPECPEIQELRRFELLVEIVGEYFDMFKLPPIEPRRRPEEMLSLAKFEQRKALVNYLWRLGKRMCDRTSSHANKLAAQD